MSNLYQLVFSFSYLVFGKLLIINELPFSKYEGFESNWYYLSRASEQILQNVSVKTAPSVLPSFFEKKEEAALVWAASFAFWKRKRLVA